MSVTNLPEFEMEPPSSGETSLNLSLQSVNNDYVKLNQAACGAASVKESNVRDLLTLLENSPDIIVRYNQDLKRIYANRTYMQQTGFSESEAIGGALLEKNVLPASTLLQFQQILVNVFETGLPTEKDFEWTDKAGIFHCFSIRLVPEFGSQGYVDSVMAIARDITDKRLSEKLLAHREQEFRVLLENSGESIVCFNIECLIVYANPNVLSHLKCSVADLVGKSPLHLFPEVLRTVCSSEISKYILSLQEVIANGCKKEFELEFIHGKELLYQYKIMLIPEKDVYGNITGVHSFGRNITEYRRTEINLRETQNRLSGIISAIPDLVWLKNKEGVYLACNKAFEDFFGADETDIVGRTDYSFVKKEIADRFRQKDREAMEAGKVCIFEEPITYAVDGRLGILETRKIPLYSIDGEVEGVLGIARDITNRKKSEQLLGEREQAYRSLAENAPENIVRYNLEGKAIYINRGHGNNGLKDPLGCEKGNYSDILDYVIKNGTKREVEIHTMSAEGDFVTQSIIFTPERDAAGNIIGALAFGRDITERKKIEEANQRLSSDLTATLQAIPDLLFEIDIKGTFHHIWTKDHWFLLMPKEAMIGRRINDILPSHVVQVVFKSLLEAKRKEASYGGIFWLDYPEGKKWFEISVSKKPGVWNSGERFLALARDITDRINAERRLRESEEKFSSAFRNSPAAFAIIRMKENVFIDVNESFSKLTGYDRKELVGQNARSIKLFRDPQKFIKALKAFHRVGNIRNVEFEFLHKNGSVKYGLVSAVTIKAEGAPGILFQIIDMTKRKKAERKLLEEQFKLSEAQRIGHIGSWEYNFESGLVTFSSEINRIYEMPPERGTSTQAKFLERVHPEDRDFVKEALINSVRLHAPCIIEHRIVLPSGRVKYVFQHSETFYGENGPVRMIGTIQDITFKKETENELWEAKEKAEESNRLKTAFLATMNHELRTPLNHIIGFGELIKARPEKSPEFVDIIMDSGHKLLDIFEDIFQLAMAEQTAIAIRRNTFNLGSMFADSSQVLSEILEVAGKKDAVELRFSPDEGLLSTNVFGDLNKINQVLGHLFKNAVKFTEKGFIEFGMVKPKPGIVKFFVRDTGIGIPKDKHPVVFEFFRQADDSNTRKYGGVGIGLAISRKITEVLKGKLSFVSEPQQGSTFYFSIPLDEIPFDQDSYGTFLS